MASNDIKIKISIDDDGQLSIVGDQAKSAATGLDDVGDAAKKTTKQTGTLNRNLKGTANMTSNSTKQFSKMSQGMTGGLVPAYAVLASNVFALSAAFNFLKRAADVKILEQSQVQFAQNSGVALQSITMRLREASDGMLGFKEAGQAAAIGLAKGFSPKQLEDLAVGARKASTALGRDFADSFDRLVRGASKAEPELLDELGITLRLADATQTYADAIGKNREELNTYQRSQAVLMETQRQLNKNFGSFEAATNPFVKLSKTFEEIIKQATQFILPVFESFAEVINRVPAAGVAVFAALAIAIIKMIIPLDGVNARIASMATKSKESWTAAKAGLTSYMTKLKEAKNQAFNNQQKGVKGVQSGAGAMVASGNKNKTLGKAAAGGTLNALDKRNISKALKSAELQFKKHGAVRTGMFANMNKKMVRDFAASMTMMETKSMSSMGRITAVARATGIAIGIAFKAAAAVAVGAIVSIQIAVNFLAAAFARLIAIASGVGIVLIIYQMGKAIYDNFFNIGVGAAKILDGIGASVATFANEAQQSFLGFIDAVVDGFRNMKFDIIKSINELIFDMAKGLENGVNSFIGLIAKVGNTSNAILGTEFDLPDLQTWALQFKNSIANVAPELSDLAASATEVGAGLTNFEDNFRANNTKAFERMDGARTDKLSNQAQGSYNDLLDKTSKELNSILETRKLEKDELKASIADFNTLKSMDIPGLYAKINETIIRTAPNQMGKMEKTESFVQSLEARQESLARLKVAMEEIRIISPEIANALAGITLEDGSALEILGVKTADAATNLIGFNESLESTGTLVRESISAGNFSEAYFALAKLKEQSEETHEALLELVPGSAAGIKGQMDQKFADILGSAFNADKVMEQLAVLKAANETIELLKASADGVRGTFKETIDNIVKKKAAQLAIEMKLFQIAHETDDAKKAALTLDMESLDLARKQAELAGRILVLKQMGEFGADDGMIKSAQNANELLSALLPMNQAYEDLQVLLDGTTDAQAKLNIEQEMAAIKLMGHGMAVSQVARQFKILGGLLSELGPDGEVLASMAEGFGNIIGIMGTSMADFFDKSTVGMDKFAAGLAIVSGMLSAVQGMMAAKSQAAIKGMDREINAEKKRDGKSSASKAKIEGMEKKKEGMKRKAFEAQKKMTMAQIVMQTALGMISTYAALAAVPLIGPGVAKAAMIAVGVMGAGILAMAASTSYQGGGAVTSASGGPTSVTVGQRQNTVDISKSQGAGGELSYMRGNKGTGGAENFRSAFTGYKHRAAGGNAGYIVGEQGPELFMPDREGTIVPSDDVGEMSSSSNVTFNINTVDASGVEELLAEQQGNIIGMLRQAANSYGEEFMEDIDTTTFANSSPRRA